MSIFLTLEEFELQETVLIPSKKLITQILDALKKFRATMVNDNDTLFKDDEKITKTLNNYLKYEKFGFLKFKMTKEKNNDLPQRFIKANLSSASQGLHDTWIIVLPGFWKTFFEMTDRVFDNFLGLVEEFLEHEFVHDLQNKAISKKIGTPTSIWIEGDDEDRKAYLSDEHELMAFARTAAVQLLKQFDKKRAIDVLRSPDKYIQDVPSDGVILDYIGTFRLEEKPWKRFVKYTIEYIEKEV